MAVLEDIKPNRTLRGVLPNGVITVVSVQWFGSGALELAYKDAAGRVGNELLYRDREVDLEIVEEGRLWSLDGRSWSLKRRPVRLARPHDREARHLISA